MENWRPTVHEVLRVVQLSRADHRVQTKRGQTYGIGLVTLRYKLTEGPTAEWGPAVVGLGAGDKAVPFADLAAVPDWLLDLEARARPASPAPPAAG